MSDTDRLYALSSTYTGPWRNGDGPRLLAADPILALCFYLTTEREEQLEVIGHVSADDGATWEPLAPHQLMAAADQALTRRRFQRSPPMRLDPTDRVPARRGVARRTEATA